LNSGEIKKLAMAGFSLGCCQKQNSAQEVDQKKLFPICFFLLAFFAVKKEKLLPDS
jgi:surfactin synthase thioesterase subunit